MSDFSPPSLAGNVAGNAAPALNPDTIETILSDFRSWLQQTATLGEQAAASDRSTSVPAEPVDLHTLLAQFVALRHEINLQTKANRAQQEQNSELIRELTEALDTLQQAHDQIDGADQQADDAKLRPLLKTLVDLHDALSLAERELLRVRETLAASSQTFTPPDLEPMGRIQEAICQLAQREAQPQQVPFWKRWLGGAEPERRSSLEPLTQEITQDLQLIQAQLGQLEKAHQGFQHIRRVFASISEGYTMSLQRVERALQQHGLDPISGKGQPFDPERMEVLDVVIDSGRPSGEVVEEVRRGYLWRGRVFRYAQVRVAKS